MKRKTTAWVFKNDLKYFLTSKDARYLEVYKTEETARSDGAEDEEVVKLRIELDETTKTS